MPNMDTPSPPRKRSKLGSNATISTPKLQKSVNGIMMSYTITGPISGKWIVLVNGLADDLTTWSVNIKAFAAAGYQVLAYDNRGIGKTSRTPGPYTAELLADDLYALLNALHIYKFHLLGVSMGGMIAQAFALKYPNGSDPAGVRKILTLSLCCTYAQPSAFCDRMFGLWADMAAKMSVQDVMRDVTLWAFTVDFFRLRTDELKEVEDAMKGLDMSLDEYLAQLNVIQQFDSTDALGKLSREGGSLGGLKEGKIMVLAGEADILIPVSLSKELHEAIPGSVWRTIRGGHGCMWEFPEQFYETVLDFLDNNSTWSHGIRVSSPSSP